MHNITVERVTNRVWGIFSSLDHGIAGNNNRRVLLRALCVPKFRFCNIDGEGRQGQVVR